MVLATSLLLVSAAYGAEEASDDSGPYVRGAVAFGFLNLPLDTGPDAQYGFTVAGGVSVRFFPRE